LTEENARAIVGLLVTKGFKADEDVQNAAVRKWAVDAGLGGILNEGLKSAAEKGWIDEGPRPGTIKLTSAGSEIGNES